MDGAFENSERKFGDILENVHLIAVCLDPEGNITFCNEFFRKMTGWALEDILGRNWFETFLPTEHRESFRMIFRRAISEGEIPAHYEGAIVTPRGERKLIIWNNTVLDDRRGKTIGALCIGQDITETRTAEKELRETYTDLAQLLSSIPSFLIGLGPDRRIKRWNSSAEKTFGIPGANVLEEPLELCGIRWNRHRIESAISQCIRQSRDIDLDNLRFVRPDGKEGFLDVTISVVNGSKGSPGIVLMGSEVTNRKILESQLAQAQKLESIGQLAAGIAHEVNTPAQYVGDNLRFLKDAFRNMKALHEQYSFLVKQLKSGNAPPDLPCKIEEAEREADIEYLIEEVPKALEQSLEGIERISRIVGAMKEFSHPGSDNKTNLDLAKAIESTLTVTKNEWKYAADVVTDFDLSMPPVPCLPGEFNQVILNLIVNATHAIIEKQRQTGSEEKGRITISTRMQDGEAEIRVGDTGTGIKEGIRSRVFDPFFTTKEVGKGTGQGLAIAHSVIVDKHGGRITFETEVGKGTVFIIRLPLTDSSVEKNCGA